MKEFIMAEVLSNKEVLPEIFDMTIYAPGIAKETLPGQFINIYTGKGEYLLPRPISVCEALSEKGELRLIYQVVGKGTEIFSNLMAGDKIRILGPLGNGFKLMPKGKHLIIGGGIGIPPLLELAKNLEGNVTSVLGAKSVPPLAKDFEKYGKVYIASEDGELGFKGNVIELIESEGLKGFDCIYACGPNVMLKAVAELGEKQEVYTQVSMDKRMACGVGACMGCAVKIKKGDGFEYLKACKDGPVFSAAEVIWRE